MKRKIISTLFALVLMLTLGLVTAVPASAADLTAITATPDVSTVGATANYTIAFTTATTDNISSVVMTFPAGFDVTGATLGATDNISDMGTITIDDQAVIYTVDDPVEIAADLDITIELEGIVNTETAATAEYLVSVTTYNNATPPVILDGPTDSGTFDIVADEADYFEVVTEHNGTETAGTAFTINLTVKDQYNNTVDFDTDDVSVNFTSTATAAPNGNEPDILDSEDVDFEDGVGTTAGTFTLANISESPTISAQGATGDDLEGVSGTSAAIFVEGENLDAAFYRTGVDVSIVVAYKAANTNPETAQTIAVKAQSTTDTDEITVAMMETSANSSMFAGSFTLVSSSPWGDQVLVQHDDTVTVTYYAPEPDYVETADVDDVSPVIDTLTLTPEDDEVTDDAMPVISAEYDDADSAIDIDSVAITVDDVDKTLLATVTDSSVTYTPSANISEGSHAVTVNVSDLAGNAATQASWSFTVDTGAPMITDLTPADGAYVNDNTPEISAVLSNGTSGIDETTIEMSVDGVDVSSEVDYDDSTGVASYTPTDNLTEAEIPVTLDVDDMAGNAAEQASWSFTVDITDPVIAIDAVTSPTSDNTQAISGTYDELNLDTITLTVNDVPVATENTTATTWATTANATLTEGDNLIVATITDLAGNKASANTTIVLDTIAPEVTNAMADPDVIQTATATEVTFSANVTDDDGSGVASVSANLTAIGGAEDQAMTDTGDGIYGYTWTDLTVAEAGTYELTITATDNAGNTNDTVNISLQVITDVDNPVISDTSVDYPVGYESARVGDEVIITAVVTDNTTEVASVTIDAEDIGLAPDEALTLTAVADTYSATLTVGAVDPDTYILTITATDLADNDATANVTVVVVSALTAYNIGLEVDWNLISLPLMPDDEDIGTILTDISDNVSQVRTWVYVDGVLTEKSWAEGGTVGDLTEMVDGQGYWIEMTEAKTLTIQGNELPGPGESMPAYDVYEGWNLIGFKSVSDVADAEDYLGGAVKLIFERMYGYDAEDDYYVTIELTGNALEPGHGYWLAISANGTIYP